MPVSRRLLASGVASCGMRVRVNTALVVSEVIDTDTGKVRERNRVQAGMIACNRQVLFLPIHRGRGAEGLRELDESGSHAGIQVDDEQPP